MDEIQDLFMSGVASAKGGNRRLAQAFFKRVIRKNPLHEGAWLWLAEVLDDPDDIAYCLEAALEINPKNETARMKLDLVRERGAEPSRPREWSSLDDLLDMDVPALLAKASEPEIIYVEHPPEQSQAQRIGWAVLFSVAILAILAMTVWMAVNPLVPENPVTPTDPVPTVDVSSLREQERQEIRVYLIAVDDLRGPLRLARDIYWGLYWGEGNPVPPLAEQVASANQLKAQIITTLDQLRYIEPPLMLREAHNEYVEGLTLEQEALDNVLRYIETSQTGYSNRAMVKFQDANLHLDRAKSIWAGYREWAEIPEPTRLPTPTRPSTPTIGPTPSATPTFRRLPTSTPTPVPTQPMGWGPREPEQGYCVDRSGSKSSLTKRQGGSSCSTDSGSPARMAKAL
jgi:hypothetical protein